MSYGENYHDRGMVKWAGFYLSEHTEQLSNQHRIEANRPKAKMQMDADEIGQILSEAQLKNKKVAIQIQEKDADGYYKSDIIGKIKGFDDLGIYVGDEKVHFDEIRHIELSKELKWSNPARFDY